MMSQNRKTAGREWKIFIESMYGSCYTKNGEMVSDKVKIDLKGQVFLE